MTRGLAMFLGAATIVGAWVGAWMLVIVIGWLTLAFLAGEI